MTDRWTPGDGWVPPEPAGPAPGFAFAPHGPRLVAYLVDAVILTLVTLVLLVGTGLVFLSVASLAVDGERISVTPEAVFGTALIGLLTILLLLLYFPFFWARGGQTPGMALFGLRVVDDQNGGRIGWGTAFLRVLGMYVASAVFYLGFIWIFVDKRRRGFHDLIAGTVVVKPSEGSAAEGRAGT
jgi:uncharacterized RDD family membrane protein YckC